MTKVAKCSIFKVMPCHCLPAGRPHLLRYCFMLALLGLTTIVNAQTISVSGKEMPLRKVFTEIEKQTGYFVFASKEMLQSASPVTVSVRNMPLQEFLDVILKDQPLKARIDGKNILLARKPAAAQPAERAKEEPPVQVRVMAAGGITLPGATIVNKTSRRSVMTDAEGKAAIQASAGDVLAVSFVGYVTREIAVSGTGRPVYAELQPSDNKLDEIQIIAYGTTSKRFNTGAVTTVKAEDIEKQPVSNPIIALSGRVPGLSMQQTTGAAGAAVRFNIRGLNSISGTNDPFIIIDGVPFNNTNISLNTGSTLGAFGGASPLNAINPSDIERIEVLKDADATAIYGSRGANGVILITTKKGKSGKMGFNVNLYQGWGQVSRKMEMLNTRQYLDMRYEAFRNDGVDWRSPSVVADDLKVWDTTRHTNWQDVLVGGTAKYTNAQAGMSGGNQFTQFNIAGTYWRETTVYPGDFHNSKVSGRFGLNHRSADNRFRMELSAFYTYNHNSLPAYNPYYTALQLAPIAPAAYTPDGKLNWEGGTFRNPMAELLVKQTVKSYNLNASTLLSYRVLKGLWLKANVGYNKVDFNTNQKNPKTSINPFQFYPTQHIARYNSSENTGWNAEPYLEYQTVLGEGRLTALLGTTFQEQMRTTQGITAWDFADDALMSNPAAGKESTIAPTSIVKYRYNAIFGRLNYTLRDRYIANLTVRRDGSSRFGPGRQFGNFGAVGLAWIFTEEQFMKGLSNILSYGKLRASYGITGSDAIGDYGFLPTYSVSGNAATDRSTLKPDRLFNPDYGWETNKKADVELELGFLDNRIMVSANYYHNLSSNQLVGIPMPAMTGFTSINSNLPATVRNTGLELAVNTVNIKSSSFSWNTSFNLTLPRNKLVNYPNLALSTHATSYAVGYPLDVRMLYDFVRVNPQTGLNVYRGANGKDTSFITSVFFTRADRTIYINSGPRVFGGMTNEFQYKNFRFDFQLVYSWKYRNNDIATMTGVPGGAFNIPLYVFNNSWRKVGDEALFQQFTQRTSSPAARSATGSSSEAYYTGVWFLRLNNLSLSYTLPKTWQHKLHTNNARVYVLAQNLFTVSNFEGIDPETGTTSMPLMRILTAGVQLNF